MDIGLYSPDRHHDEVKHVGMGIKKYNFIRFTDFLSCSTILIILGASISYYVTMLFKIICSKSLTL